MTPIPTSYLARDLYAQAWTEATPESPKAPRPGLLAWLPVALAALAAPLARPA